jgi:protein-tyrosine phosphatase
MPHLGEELLAQTREGAIGIAEIEQRVREIYRRFVTDQSSSYAQLLRLIEADALPLLFHCTSGRDRTGFASAVVLMALGVSRSTIAEDYALSNRYRRDLTFQIGGAVSPEVMATLTQAHPEYLAAAFATIDQHHGSDAAYLREALGLDAARQRQLQDLLLEPA